MNNLWLDLLNSDWHDNKGSGRNEDRLTNNRWLKRFLSPWENDLRNISLDKIQKSLINLRQLIRKMAGKFSAGYQIPKKDLEALNLILRQSPKIVSVKKTKSGYEKRINCVSPGLHSMLGDFAESFVDALTEGDPSRIKICINPECNWIFYDRSKNRSRKWCGGTDSCGNLIKVRRFRAKNRSRV